jgi:hypothetical protein
MPKESTPGEPLRLGSGDFGDMERDVVYLLTDPERYPMIWSVPDIGRELAYFDPMALVHPLVNAGLLHKTRDGYVFATPAAYHMVGLVGHVL